MQHSYNVKSSGNIAATAGAQIPASSNQKGLRYHGMTVSTATTATAVVTLYHGIAATAGNEIDSISIPAGTSAVSAVSNLCFPVDCPNGLFIVVTGTGATANVRYSVGA